MLMAPVGWTSATTEDIICSANFDLTLNRQGVTLCALAVALRSHLLAYCGCA